MSNEERYKQIVVLIDGITTLVRDYVTEFDDRRDSHLQALLTELWPALLCGRPSGCNATTESTVSGTSLIGIALLGLKPIPEEREEEGYQQVARELTDVSTLANDNRLRTIIDINNKCEEAQYCIHRYEDALAKRLATLDQLMAKIRGECYRSLKDERNFLKAYLLHQISRKLLTYDKNDLVNQVWEQQCLHHDVRAQDEVSTELLLELWSKFQFQQQPVPERLYASFQIAGRRFHSPHQHKQVMEMAKKYNLQHKKNPIDLDRLQGIFDHAIKLDNEFKENNHIEHYCHLTGESGIYQRIKKRKRSRK